MFDRIGHFFLYCIVLSLALEFLASIPASPVPAASSVLIRGTVMLAVAIFCFRPRRRSESREVRSTQQRRAPAQHRRVQFA